MTFEAAFRTDVGKKRQKNQDNGRSLPEKGLFLVADGMGGHRGGETASAMAAEIIAAEIPPFKLDNDNGQSNDAPLDQILVRAISEANRVIYDRSLADAELHGMGTTTTALLLRPSKAVIGHVGDSRCYYLRPGAIWQLTRDHSLVQEKLAAGLITRDQVRTDRMKNVITRSVGFEPEVNVEVFEWEPQAGDLFLLCSDGLSGLVSDAEIRAVAEEYCFEKNDLEGAVERLVELANDNGGDDNVTALLVRIKP